MKRTIKKIKKLISFARTLFKTSKKLGRPRKNR